METQEWTFDTAWRERAGAGQWDREPDKRQWLDDATQLPCLIVRNNMGALCGYVGVSKGHPWFGEGYDEVYDLADGLEVHGGLTFAGPCQTGGKICHVVEEGEDDDVWWLGFDCAHAGDYSPTANVDLRMMNTFLDGFSAGETYRDMDYVTFEVTGLAQQAGRAEEIRP